MLTFNNYPYSEDGRLSDGHPSDVAIVGMPSDLGVTHYYPGQRLAPTRIREVHIWDEAETGLFTQDGRNLREMNVVDTGDAFVYTGDLVATLTSFVDHVEAIRSHTDTVVILGGDNSVSLAGLRGFGDKRPWLILFDAHSDMYQSVDGESVDHGNWVMQAFDEDLIEGVVFVGVRSYDETAEHYGIYADRCTDDVTKLPQDSVVYIAVDMDVVDPAYAPGVGTREPFGMAPSSLLQMLEAFIMYHEVCGVDFTEVLPSRDHDNMTSELAAQLVMKVIDTLHLKKTLRKSTLAVVPDA